MNSPTVSPSVPARPSRTARRYAVAAFFAVAAEAAWSARWLDQERLLQGVALYAVFGLFYLGVPLLARRLGRRLPPAGSGAVLLLLSLALLFFLATGELAPAALWGLALLLLLLNAGLFVEAGTARLPLLALAGTVLSWVLIAAWWAAVPLSASVAPVPTKPKNSSGLGKPSVYGSATGPIVAAAPSSSMRLHQNVTFARFSDTISDEPM